MSQEEAKRGQLLALMETGKISQQEGAKRMGITPRQAHRLAKRYRIDGLPGLINKQRGKPSNRRMDEALKITAMQLVGAH
ncbi:MAG: helix-turn-helix domain-containing protein, partial [Burkholderiales bacterium]